MPLFDEPNDMDNYIVSLFYVITMLFSGVEWI